MEYKYDAFISYRHGGVDQFVAERLHKKLESFKLPKRLKDKSNGKERITRVFRDQDELPLSSNLEDSIKEALKVSEWLIVICTPRLKESIWCLKEIETFIEMHGQDHVLAVLVEGEPYESFPAQLRSKKIVKFDGMTGQQIVLEEKVEPLAADVRAESRKKIKTLMDTEILRLLAPMFGVDFDDLKQRQRARKARRIGILAAIVIGLSLGFGVYSEIMYLRIAAKNDEINKQNKEIAAQNKEITAKNDEIEEKQSLIEEQMQTLLYEQSKSLAKESLQYNRRNAKERAAEIAYSALTDEPTDETLFAIPQTSYTTFALSEALGCYNYGNRFIAMEGFDVGKQAVFAEGNGSTDYILVQFTDKTVALYERSSDSIIWEGKLADCPTRDFKMMCFFNDREFAVAEDNGLNFYSIDGSTVTNTGLAHTGDYVNYFKLNADKTKVIVNNASRSMAIDVNTKSKVFEVDDGYVDYINDNRFAAAAEGGVVIYDTTLNTEGPYVFIPVVANYYNAFDFIVDPDDSNLCYVNVAYAGEEILDYTTKVYCVNMADGSIVWEYTNRSLTPTIRVVNNGTKYLALYDQYEFRIIDINTGIEIDSYESNSSEDHVVDIVQTPNSNIICFLLTNGELVFYNESMGFTITTASLEAGDSSITSIYLCGSEYGTSFITTLTQNTEVSLFAYNHPSNDMIEIEDFDTYKSGTKQADIYRGADSIKKATDLGLADAKIMSCLLVLKDEKLVIAKNSAFLRVYDLDTKELIFETSEIVSDHVFQTDYATDSEGNLFIFCADFCYIFDENKELIGCARGAYGFDKDTQKLVYSSAYGYYEGGVYTLDELLKMAEAKYGF